MIDILNEGELLLYLNKKGLVRNGENVITKILTGGVSANVVLVQSEANTFIVKKALGQLKVNDEWLCSPKRIIVEAQAHEVYHEILGECVPEVLIKDDENNLIVRNGAPYEAEMWKTLLMNGLFDFKLADKVITALANVHRSAALDSSLSKSFADKSIFYDLRINPYLEFCKNKHPKLEKEITKMINKLMNENLTLVHGDYSPKNIMTMNDKFWIIDFEVAHFGNPIFDLAFFINHFMLKSVKNKQWADSYINLSKLMLKRYFTILDDTFDVNQMEKDTVQLFGMLFLARVDGKSPAEYITEKGDKSLIKKISYEIILNNWSRFEDVYDLLKKNIYQE